MATLRDRKSRKRPVNLTLSETLVARARKCTDNLSAVVESLLEDFVDRERQRRATEVQLGRATAAVWNRFEEEIGSFADEHSTL